MSLGSGIIPAHLIGKEFKRPDDVNTKQVIVVRRDLEMSPGKLAAQVAHASMAFLTGDMAFGWGRLMVGHLDDDFLEEVQHWIAHSFRKIVVGVDSEEQLLELHEENQRFSSYCSKLITDNGATEFNGEPTNTCLAIGPHWD